MQSALRQRLGSASYSNQLLQAGWHLPMNQFNLDS